MTNPDVRGLAWTWGVELRALRGSLYGNDVGGRLAGVHV